MAHLFLDRAQFPKNTSFKQMFHETIGIFSRIPALRRFFSSFQGDLAQRGIPLASPSSLGGRGRPSLGGFLCLSADIWEG
jgi:hypothetical protein